jgi:hypothetical protein
LATPCHFCAQKSGTGAPIWEPKRVPACVSNNPRGKKPSHNVISNNKLTSKLASTKHSLQSHHMSFADEYGTVEESFDVVPFDFYFFLFGSFWF